MKDDGTAEYAYQQVVKDRANRAHWAAEAARREDAGRTRTKTPTYSGLLSGFFN